MQKKGSHLCICCRSLNVKVAWSSRKKRSRARKMRSQQRQPYYTCAGYFDHPFSNKPIFAYLCYNAIIRDIMELSLLGTSVLKIGDVYQYNLSRLSSYLHEEGLVPRRSTSAAFLIGTEKRIRLGESYQLPLSFTHLLSTMRNAGLGFRALSCQ